MDLISKTLYTDKLAAIVDRSNNAYYRTMKIKSIDIKTTRYIDFDVKILTKILNLKVMIM